MTLFEALEESAVSRWVLETDSIWSYPTVLTLHTLGLGLLVGTSWVLAARVFGIGRSIPLRSMRALFPVAWIGFWINAVTGSILFAADATTRGTSVLFLAKLTLVAIGVITVLLVKRDAYAAGPEPRAVTASTKLLAAASVVAWIAAITAGRLLAYLS
jgi:hypothetical protein